MLSLVANSHTHWVRKFVGELHKKIIHVDQKGLETVLQAVHVSDFLLTEFEENCYTVEVVTRTMGGSEMGCYQVDRIRNGGAKVWKNAESCVQWIKSITVSHSKVTITIILNKSNVAP